LVNIEQIKVLVHASGVSRLDQLLMLLAAGDGGPKTVSDVKELAETVGLRWLRKANISDRLSRCNGAAIRTSAGWELSPESRRMISKKTLTGLTDSDTDAGVPKEQPLSARGAKAVSRIAAGGAGVVFIGHGRASAWREVKDFVDQRLKLQWEEFNRTPVAGLSAKERLITMLDRASFALLVMTAEDAHADQTVHARANVIHEAGLFQGRLGFERAIILLEDGCEEFTNVVGLCQLRFPKGRVSAIFEDIRAVMEREALLTL
jgi:predicted nucleotide-binding protein